MPRLVLDEPQAPAIIPGAISPVPQRKAPRLVLDDPSGPEIRSLPKNFVMRKPTPEENQQDFDFTTKKLADRIFTRSTGLTPEQGIEGQKKLSNVIGRAPLAAMTIGGAPLVALGFETLNQAKNAIVAAGKKQKYSPLDRSLLSELIPDKHPVIKIGSSVAENLADIALIGATANLAKQGLLKDTLKVIGDKLTAAGYGKGKMTINLDALKEASKGTTLDIEARRWLDAKMAKVNPLPPSVPGASATPPQAPSIPALAPAVPPSAPIITPPIAPVPGPKLVPDNIGQAIVLPPHLQKIADKAKGFTSQDVTPPGYGPEEIKNGPIKTPEAQVVTDKNIEKPVIPEEDIKDFEQISILMGYTVPNQPVRTDEGFTVHGGGAIARFLKGETNKNIDRILEKIKSGQKLAPKQEEKFKELLEGYRKEVKQSQKEFEDARTEVSESEATEAIRSADQAEPIDKQAIQEYDEGWGEEENPRTAEPERKINNAFELIDGEKVSAPWKMTLKDYIDQHPEGKENLFAVKNIHAESVKDAISAGKPVPQEVLEDYPADSNLTPSGQIKLELQPPIKKDLFQAGESIPVPKGDLFEKAEQPEEKGLEITPEEIERVSKNILKNNPDVAKSDAEAMARDIIRNRKSPENKNIAEPSEKFEKITDPVEVQKIKNSIAEGETILRAANTPFGRKMSSEELEAIKRAIEKAKAKIGLQDKPKTQKEIVEEIQKKTEKEARLKGETIDDMMARKVGYQIDNGIVKIEETKFGWKATVKDMTGDKPKMFFGYVKKEQLIEKVYKFLYPESKGSPAASVRREQSLPTPAKTPQEFSERVDQLNKFGQSKAILRKSAHLKKYGGLFQPIPKKGEIKITQEVLLDDRQYMDTLAHELGHAIQYNVTGNIKQNFDLFGKGLDSKTIKIIRRELEAVTEDLEGKERMAAGIPGDPGYFFKANELIARFFEKVLSSPGNLQELAPTAFELIEKQAVIHPIINEFFEAARGEIDKGAPKVVLLRDLRETHQKYLGKRVGNIAYGEYIVYRAMKERGKVSIEKLIKEKFKGVKDSPELLFNSAESIKVSRGGIPEFGTRDFVTAHNLDEELVLVSMGYDKMPMPVTEDGRAYPQFAKQRYSEEQGKKFFDALSPEGKKLILGFTAERAEAKDYFNREVIKDVNKIKGNIEGWVFHYFEDDSPSTILGGNKFKNKIAGTRNKREGKEGYVKDFQKAMTRVLIDLEGEKSFNDFVKRYFAMVTRPLAQGAEPIPGWVEVVGSLKSGVGLPQEKRIALLDKNTGEKIPIRQVRYQMPKAIYERFKLWRGLIEEASLAVRIVSDLNRYWRVNILAHPGTAMTNNISGGVQYSAKILTDFYGEVLTGDAGMPKTKANVSAIIKALLPKGWNSAPDWVYGGDMSNFYGQFMKQESPVSQAIDEYGNKALKLFSLYERYWKKVISLSEGVQNLESLNKMDVEGLRIPTEEERELIKSINEEVDLYGYDYDNVPTWLEAHQRSATGQAIKPFAKYPYKYAKQILNMVGSAFDGSLPWQERVAKILALTTMVGAYAMFSRKRKEEQKTPVADLDVEIPARVQTRGRLFITTDENGNELFMRVAKYPFINLTEAGMAFVDGNLEGAKDGLSEMIGSIGPAAQVGLLALNNRNKYQTYDPVPVVIGNALSTFTPGYRILADLSKLLDPFQRKQKAFGQTFTKLIPTTSEDLQEKLHGDKRLVKVPVEGAITGAEGKRTTIDVLLENYWQDILLSMLSGVYINRVDPDVANAYIIRKEKNLEKAKKEEVR